LRKKSGQKPMAGKHECCWQYVTRNYPQTTVTRADLCKFRSSRVADLMISERTRMFPKEGPMRLLSTTLAVMVIAALAPNFALADDHEIARQILSQLEVQKKSGALKNFGVNLQVEKGTVLVRGRTVDASQKKLVLDIARRVDGVQQVVSELEIKPYTPAAKTAEKPKAKPLTTMFDPAAAAPGAIKIKTPSPVPAAANTKAAVKTAPVATVEKAPAKKDFVLPPVQMKRLPESTATAAKPATPGSYTSPAAGSKLVDQKLFARTPVTKTVEPIKTPQPVATAKPVHSPKGGEYLPAFTAPVHKAPAKTAQRVTTPAKNDNRQLVAQQPELRETKVAVHTQPRQNSGQLRQATHNQAQPPVRTFDEPEAAPVQVATPMPVKTGAPAQGGQPTASQLAQQMPVGARAVLTPQGWVFEAPRDNTPVAFSPAMGANYNAPSHETYRAAAARYQMMRQQQAMMQRGGASQGRAPIQRVANLQPAGGAPATLPGPPPGSAPGGMGQPPMGQPAMGPGGPAPGHHYLPNAGGKPAAQYDHPQMPGYAWPTYASHPNYGAVTYPKQYSPTAWPYIGPFYPYPQVPLGWRKVTLEWDDGWWFLDFKNRH